ncbi:DUF817 domain-containing protein [Solimonas sp. C16B3]|uniref:DUF817 domain-containing protein n=1 Tax=Solimonas marina TaxID=2714601 RepID=A0A969W9M2_9GAMM|nr:DUF817 domain-containing protein [Solimonas marina]
MSVAAHDGGGLRSLLHDLLLFARIEAQCCVFAVAIFGGLALSKLLALPIPRYDFLLIWCLCVQALMLLTRIETADEALVICLFHVFGLALELFKTHHGSWAYPEFAYTKFWGVPLYSGFMYAAVASYLVQAFRRLDLHFSEYPSDVANLFAILLYVNFFTNAWMPDQRWGLATALVALMWKTRVDFRLGDRRYSMPLVVSFALIGFFIWLAENIATFFGAWRYPNQRDVWHSVHYAKISSWALLVILSFVLIARLKGLKASLGVPDGGSYLLSRLHLPKPDASRSEPPST